MARVAETGSILYLLSGAFVSDPSREKLAEIPEIYRRAGFYAGSVPTGIADLLS